MSSFYQEKLDAFMAGLAIVRECNPAASFQAEHDVIYVALDGVPDFRRADVIALGHGWHDASDVDSLGFFT